MKLKLLRVIRSLHPAGGGPIEGIRQITPHLAALGVTTTVASLDPPDAPWLKDQPYRAIGLGPVARHYGYRRGIPSIIQSIAKEYDLVVIEGIWQYHAYATWRALHTTNIPYCVYPHGMLDPWFKRTYPIKHLKKWMYWPWADYRVLRDARFVLFTTDKERLLARESFWLYKANEIVVGYGASLPPGDINNQREVFLNAFPRLRGKRILLFLSRIHPKKGIDILIEAFAAVAVSDPRLHLVVAGPDQVDLQSTLQNRAAELGISDRIVWPGMLSGDIKWGAFHAAELFCLPSHQENFGVVVAEAMACGLPIAISEPVNISAEVAAAGAGLVHTDTVISTTEALIEWLKLSSLQRTQMGERGARLFHERFDFKSVAKNLLPVFESAIRETKSSPVL